MKRIVILGLLCLILLASCVSADIVEDLEKVSDTVPSSVICYTLSMSARACEFRLRDGTLCVVGQTTSSQGGAAITCNWK